MTKLQLKSLYFEPIVIAFIWCSVLVLLPEDIALAWMFSIIPAVLYISQKNIAGLPVLLIAAVLLPFFKLYHNLKFVIQYDIFLIATTLYVYHTQHKLKTIDNKFLPVISELNSEIRTLKEQENSLQAKHKELKSKLTTITELYHLSKEIAEHLYLKDIVQHFSRTVFNREILSDIVKSIVFFQFDFEKGTINEETVYFSNITEAQLWKEIVYQRRELLTKREILRFTSTMHFPFDTILIFPLILEDILGYFAFRIKTGNEEKCIAELEPLLGQLPLAIKRSALFLEVERLSRRDGLTGLFLRRYFLERLDEEILRAKRYNNKFAIFMVDIDHFKNVNDNYGHLAGDFVLKELAEIFVTNLHKGDLISRYGGEEFIICVQFQDKKECRAIADNIRLKVENTKFIHNNKEIHITISIGIAYYPENGDSKDKLIESSDKAMYLAKQKGRNRVIDFQEVMTA